MDSPLAGTPGPIDSQPPTPPARRRPQPVGEGATAEGAPASDAGTSPEGAPAPEGEKLPDAGFDSGGKPADAAAPAADAKPAKGKRQRTEVTPEVEAKLKAMRAEGKTFMDIHRETGIAIGTIQKYTKAESKARAKAQAASAKPAKAKTKGKAKTKRAAKPAAAASAPRSAKTSDALKARLFDLLAEGYSASDIRAALGAVG